MPSPIDAFAGERMFHIRPVRAYIDKDGAIGEVCVVGGLRCGRRILHLRKPSSLHAAPGSTLPKRSHPQPFGRAFRGSFLRTLTSAEIAG